MPLGCKPVKGDGTLTADIMIVGGTLNEQESLLELPFQGMGGRMLDVILKEANINRAEIYITNVVKCRTSHIKYKKVCNRPPFKNEVDKCKTWLYNEICVVQPKIIITLGKVPTQVLLYKSEHMKKKIFSLKDMAGQKYEMDYRDEMEEINFTSTIIPAFHPNWLLQHGKQQVSQCIEIFKLAKELV